MNFKYIKNYKKNYYYKYIHTNYRFDLDTGNKDIFYHRNYINYQEYDDCPLVAVVNAWIYLNKVPIRYHSGLYRDLYNICNGGLSIKKAINHLNLEYQEIAPTFEALKQNLKLGRPVLLSDFSHAVLCIEVREMNIKLLNSYSTKDTWMNWNDYEQNHRSLQRTRRPWGLSFVAFENKKLSFKN